MTELDIDRMTLEQTRAAASELLDSVDGDLTGSDAHRFDALTKRADQLRAREREHDAQLRDLNDGIRAGRFMMEGEGRSAPGYGRVDPYSEDRPPRTQHRDPAMRTLEARIKSGALSERGAELVENLIRTGPGQAQTWTQRWAVTTGSEDYERAFAKKLADPDNGHLTWTPQEADAWRAVAAVQAERAMSLTDNVGGFLVPLTADPAVLLSSNGSTNPLREISRVVQIATDTWNGVSSAGVSAEWIAEAAEVADASPTLAQPSVPVYKADAFVPFSFEIQGDAPTFMSELSTLLQDAADQLTATAYTTGDGSGKPTGVIAALAGGSSVVTGDGSEALAASDVFKVQNALPPRFQPRAQWNANLAIINTLRQFETTNGALKFPELANNPPMLLGRTVRENSNMDGTINPAATEANHVLLYGDFQQFLIVDRVGSTLELVPHLFGSNRRPTGQRGALLWFRTGSDVLVDNAFRVLNVATTA